MEKTRTLQHHNWSRPGTLYLLGATLMAALTACTPHQTSRPPAPAPLVKAPALSTNAPATSSRTTGLDALFPISQSRPLFDGASLRGWKVTEFAGHGDVAVEPNITGAPAIVFEPGAALTGITWTNAVPKMDYEISLEAMKLLGSDFFCGLTFPLADSFCTFIMGGWGGTVVGISSVDGQDASLNETTKYIKFEENRWYRIRVQVTRGRIQTWIDSEKMVDLETSGKKISMRFGEIEESEPLGMASYQTRAALRNISLRRLPSPRAK